jgi:hypothetical protein
MKPWFHGIMAALFPSLNIATRWEFGMFSENPQGCAPEEFSNRGRVFSF